MTVNSNATLNLQNSGTDPLYDGANSVNVINNSTTSLNVTAGTKHVGNISGPGRTTVSGGASLKSVEALRMLDRNHDIPSIDPLLVHAEVEGDRQNERRRHTVQDEG